MSSVYTLNTSMVTPGATVTSSSSQADGAEATLSEAFSASQTNKEYSIAFPYARLKKLAIKSTVDCTLKFNSTSDPLPALALAASKTFVYDSEQPYDSLFTADITKVYLTAVSAGDLQIYALYDPTP